MSSDSKAAEFVLIVSVVRHDPTLRQAVKKVPSKPFGEAFPEAFRGVTEPPSFWLSF